MKARALIRLKFISSKHLRAVMDALSPEINKPAPGRSQTTVRNEDNFLIIEVEAEDIVALRSTLNSYLRWIDSLNNVFSVLDTEPQ